MVVSIPFGIVEPGELFMRVNEVRLTLNRLRVRGNRPGPVAFPFQDTGQIEIRERVVREMPASSNPPAVRKISRS